MVHFKKEFERTKDCLLAQLEKINNKGDISPTELESIYKMFDIIKDGNEICLQEMEMEGDYDSDYSERGMSRRYSRRYSNGYYGEGYIMGGYPSDNYGYSDSWARGNGGNQYSNRNSRDGDKEWMVGQLRAMMNRAESEKERSAIQKCLRELEM